MPVDLSIAPPGAPEVEVESGTTADEIPELPAEAPQVDDTIVRGLVKGMGGVIGTIAGDDDVPDHWRFTEQELDDLVPPLTRMINRRPRWRAAVIRGDEATVALALASYGGRNVKLGREAEEARNGNQPREASPAADGDRAAAAGAAGEGRARSFDGPQLRDSTGGDVG